MIVPGSALRVFLAPGSTDRRRSFDGLYGLVRSGPRFLFCNRRRPRLPVLCFDGTGLWICAQRLERGTFTWPGRGRRESAAVRGGAGGGKSAYLLIASHLLARIPKPLLAERVSSRC